MLDVRWFERVGMKRKAYKTDLTDAQWQVIEPLIPPAKKGGRQRTVDIREILNAIFYVIRTGCSWEMIPHEFSPYSTVYFYFRRWQRMGVWQKINNALRQKVRAQEGRNSQPTAAIADSQSVKTTEKRGASALGGFADLKHLAWKYTDLMVAS